MSPGERIDAEELRDPRSFASGPPHERFAELRERGLADAGRGPTGVQLWSAFRHADIAAISKDTETFSSHECGVFPHPDQMLPLSLARTVLLYKDPPEHTKYRAFLQKAFVPNTIRSFEGEVRRIVTEAIDAFADRGECEFVEEFSVPVTMRVLALLLGLPDDEIAVLRMHADRLEKGPLATEPGSLLDHFAELSVYLSSVIERQKREGGENITKLLLDAEVDGERIDELELTTLFGVLAFAGNDTTRNTLSGGMRALLENPDQLELIAREPERIENAVEEILRWTSVVNYFCRTATRDAEVGGCPVGAGDKVMLWYPSGSRDPEVNPDPERFDVTRENPQHQAFGGGGRHFCLGAGLARLELRVALEELLRRLDQLKLAGEPRLVESNWSNGHASLPISFTRAG